MTTHFSIINADGKKLLVAQIIVDLSDELQMKALFKSLRELEARNKTTPITEADLIPPSEPVTNLPANSVTDSDSGTKSNL